MLKPQFINDVIIMKPVLEKNYGYTTRPVTSSECGGGGVGGWIPEVGLERQVAGRLRQVPLAIGGRSHVGRDVDRTDGVTGADQEVC